MMRRTRPVVGAAALAVLAVLAVLTVLAFAMPAPHAYAEAKGRIVRADPKPGQLDVVFQALDLPPDAQLDPRRVTLTVNDKPVTATTTSLSGASAAITRATMLTLDVSLSMRGARLANAKQAAQTFLDQAPPDVLIGVASFSEKAQVLVAPTRDRARAKAAVRGLTAVGATALYDGVSLSLTSLRGFDVANIVLLSDGRNDGNAATLPPVLKQLRSSKVVLDVVALDARSVMDALTALARAAHGSVVQAKQARDLVKHFAIQATDLTHQLLVSAALPAGTPSGSATVTVTAMVGSVPLTDTIETLLEAADTRAADLAAAGPQPSPINPGPLSSPLMAILALFMLFAGVAVILGLAFNVVAGTVADSGIRQRLAIYTLGGRKLGQETTRTPSFGERLVTRSAVELAGRLVARRGLEEKLAVRLEAAGTRLKPAEWILIHVGVAVLLPLFLFLLTGGSFARASIGLLLGALAPYLYMSYRGHRRRRQFFDQLPNTLQLLAGSLEAGHSLPQAVDTVARESDDPMSTEFNRAIVQARLGVPVDDALDGVADRMQCLDFSWVVMAIRIQREVGGNLAEILKTVAATLRERERLRRQVHSLSAEGRLSAWILGTLPIAFASYLILVRPGYVGIMVTTLPGILLSILGVLLMVVGVLWLRRVVDVEV